MCVVTAHQVSQIGPIDWNVYENCGTTEMNIMLTEENKAELRSEKEKHGWTTEKVM